MQQKDKNAKKGCKEITQRNNAKKECKARTERERGSF
jgi:hypothetical protein